MAPCSGVEPLQEKFVAFPQVPLDRALKMEGNIGFEPIKFDCG